ncbi:MAG: glycoside hydrolase family 19 protein [gamma proteobacterium symbiont of Ctena orbiculata]|nr:glycoside hydrolase family 19 protein [Candidatus Thiodiazotropha taylori]MBT3057569.1 glycoside hydrolase family 19 protein [Candidatus Thiodiazotropha sp. (ex Lucina pensylvanica)]MBT3064029.1 glycoside hydrolase family 19 protein [Candidatus Thiodiazotropha sp. (ex Lucina pensylvanica)]MBV2097343.1 glycoside hydrolase family 19 protein [Candidatus Thiodiazotropha sp. (ex Codakia orbicularis)]
MGVSSTDAEQYIDDLELTLPKYGIANSKVRLAHFFSQVLHESGCMRYDMENLNYSAKALRAVFGKYFKTKRQAEGYARQPEKIANKVYANRMGNGAESSGDGWRYRGRGLIQLTGKNNYRAFAKWIGDDRIIDDPDLVASEYAVHSAVFYWDKNNLNRIADKDDVVRMTKRINGGTNGLAHRTELLTKAKGLLAMLDLKPARRTA